MDDRKEWERRAQKELKTRKLDDLVWKTPEGINIKPLYTQDDIPNKSHFSGLPGICLLYTSPSPRDSDSSRMPSSA